MSFVVGIEGGGQIQILLEGATCDGVAGTNAKVVAVLKRAVEAKLKLDVNSPAATAMVSAKIGKRMPQYANGSSGAIRGGGAGRRGDTARLHVG